MERPTSFLIRLPRAMMTNRPANHQEDGDDVGEMTEHSLILQTAAQKQTDSKFSA